MNRMVKILQRAWLVSAVVCAPALADAVIDWNIKAGDLVTEAKLNAQYATRALTMMHAAIYEASNAITQRYPSRLKLTAPPGASVDAAIAAASRATLLRLLPAQRNAIEAACAAALAGLPEGPAKTDGIAVGEQAAAAMFTLRAEDLSLPAESYRPVTTPGVYVPTVVPAVPQWPKRRPWLMATADQFRPGPPPRLDSAVWAHDFVEVKDLGAKNSTRRTAEQTEIARFWEATLPPIYHGVVRSVAGMPGREVTQNARLFAAITQATDDGFIAVFEAKYHYGFWRPITAIRNGDLDGNDATDRDPSWAPFIDTPMHPEYPCAHCITASAVATVLRAELGTGPVPRLTTTSPTAGGASRSWTSLDDFVREVSMARIYDGVHYRTSTEAAVAMGQRLGELAVAKVLRAGE
ncbi:MAG: vanadium-dependent haloperoxidase [Geothrix sp.]|uniref:vanadium-dependent haloperoxidase n=1 Tax=Geothrix sp. TaxID=1962974 RepID=UPI001819632A|nr:vanadium-dependent haloperoxidase [Geothrix sp.]NWJ42003.1 vanadium-dependent haloperoxidase [Geothrix sp.]WIL20026.1 MAG: vanadium-dependent haloperoxidase [Geothrix sp.]